jgi:hypothetical protein
MTTRSRVTSRRSALGAVDYGTTAGEERVPEPLEERVRRERPDRPARDEHEVGQLIDLETVETTSPDGRTVAGEAELVDDDQLDPDDDFTGDETLRDFAMEHEGPRPAEEAAVHEENDPTSYPGT